MKSGRPLDGRLLRSRCGRAAPFISASCAVLLSAGWAAACDGKSYNFEVAVGSNVSGGGLTVRVDKAKLLADVPDKYYISVKDDGEVLAEHTLLMQGDSISFKTRCGTVSIGADRASMFSHSTLALNWSYF